MTPCCVPCRKESRTPSRRSYGNISSMLRWHWRHTWRQRSTNTMTQTVREIDVTELGSQVEHALSEAVHHLPPDYLEALQAAYHNEDFEPARDIIGMLLENAEYAASEQIPTCQDTGMAVLHIEVGQDVH